MGRLSSPKPWFTGRPELKADVETVIARWYRDLRLTIEAEIAVLRGTFPVTHDGQVLDRFAIEIRFPSDYPDTLPEIRETAGRLPWTNERHVNPDGAACVIVPEEWLVRGDGTFGSFMSGPVNSYFLAQALVEMGEPWPHGERSHGRAGVLEAYADLIGVADSTLMIAWLRTLENQAAKGHWPCPCGNGRILRRCHGEEFRALRARITPTIARQMLARLQTFVR